MIRYHRPAAALALLLATSALSACGGDSSLSAADLRTNADAICQRVRTEVKTVAEPSTAPEAALAFDKLVAINIKGIADMKALKASKADQPTLTKMTAILDDANVDLVKSADAYRANDETAVSAAGDSYAAKIIEFAATAKAAGFTACGESPPPAATTTTTTTAPPVTEAPPVTKANASSNVSVASPFEFVNLNEMLNPISGYEVAALPTEANDGLINVLAKNPDVVELVSAVGTSSASKGDQQALLIFLSLKRALPPTDLKNFVDGVTDGGTNIEEHTVAGQTGWAYTDSNGKSAFITVRGTTAILALSDNTDHLVGVVTGLFESNPQL